MANLSSLIADELRAPVDPRVVRLGEAIARQHGGASRAVLFYGSCLRQAEFDGLMLDFYLIVSDYRTAYRKKWLALANQLVPPNVFYFENEGLASKYAVLSEAHFHRLNGPETVSVSVWARFAQPSRLVWVADEQARERAISSIARAAPTLLWAAGARAGEEPLARWQRAFALTYSAELRVESIARAISLVDADRSRFEKLSLPVLEEVERLRARRSGWVHRKVLGKALSLVRLAKASMTFAGGADYIAWKINRHAGTAIELRPWQRRHPLLAGISLLPHLLKSGAVR